MKKKINTGNEKESKGIEYYYAKNRFLNLVWKTKKITDLFYSKEALFSFILTSIFAYLYLKLVSNGPIIDPQINEENIKLVLDIANSILPTIVAGLFGLLGFTIGGLAIVTGTIEKDIIDTLREGEKIDHFISVIFNFYFSGAITGLTIIISLFTLIIIHYPADFNYYYFIICSFILSYFVIFSVIYAVMLLGTCIRIFLLKYYYHDKKVK